jgi:hypothetical protein
LTDFSQGFLSGCWHKFFVRSKHANTRQRCAKSRQNNAETRQIPSQLQKQKAAISKLSLIQAYSKPLPERNSAKLKKKLQTQNFNFSKRNSG